ncbi:vWA domain-containing protein [Devosia submarina]|uniref:vWA domain-containing protein n=1 Tax=Devosia submarina TaxID=1173082 RepID=UPI000D3DC422|nr:VWA domain-containing protein [Devosia submarina]
MSNDMPGDPLNRLKDTSVPPARAEARQAALAAGMAAFENSAAKTVNAPKGNPWGRRLKSIINFPGGKTIMDMRLPIGTAAIALLVLPLGYQLYLTTSMTQVPSPISETTAPAPAQVPPPRQDLAKQPQDSRTQAPAAPEPLESEIGTAADSAAMMESMPAPPPPVAPAPMLSQGGAAMEVPTTSFAPMSDMVVVPPLPAGDQFTSFEEQRLKLVAEEPVSTFSIDVDTASYSYMRSMLEDGFLPEPDAVRIEEMINYFPYDYPAAQDAAVPFQPTIAIYPTPWNTRTQLLQIGIKGHVPPAGEDKPANLVFLIDTSGSMDEPDKLPLLKRAFALLLDQLSANDTISIVTYAGSAGVALEPTAATNKATILQALDNLWAGGSTAGADGIELAYRLAEQHKVADGTNRVILATDGDFNVGIEDPEQLEDFIKARRDSGITLSVLGFGRGNLGDDTMQALAQNGNGNASYISDFREAQKVLVQEIGGTLEMIAKDVKIQVEFNPAMVSEYRLIGYETRALNREDFNNDKVDAGDIGAGHSVTALYEITPVGSGGELVDPLRYGSASQPIARSGEWAFLRLRYKLPQSEVSQLIEQPITSDMVHSDIAQASDDMRFAAAIAAFGQKLRGSNYSGEMSWDAIAALARSGRGTDESGYRNEFLQLVQTAKALKPDAVPAVN